MVKDNNCAWAVTRPGESVPFVVCDTKGCALSIAAKCAVVSDCIQGDTPEKAAERCVKFVPFVWDEH